MDYLNEILKVYNCSYSFLPNMFGITYQSKNEFRLLNTYLRKEGDPVHVERLYLVYDPPDYIRFEEFLKFISRDDHFLNYEELKTLKILSFEIPRKYDYDYYAFLEGRYSLFSDEFKKTFPKIVRKTYVDPKSGFNVYKDDLSLAYMIINKDKALKTYWEKLLDVKLDDDSEVWEKPNLEKEILKYDSLTNSIK